MLRKDPITVTSCDDGCNLRVGRRFFIESAAVKGPYFQFSADFVHDGFGSTWSFAVYPGNFPLLAFHTQSADDPWRQLGPHVRDPKVLGKVEVFHGRSERDGGSSAMCGAGSCGTRDEDEGRLVKFRKAWKSD